MIEVIQAPEQEVCLIGCDTISVTYQLVGEEPVMVEVEWDGVSTNLDRPVYEFFIGELGYSLGFGTDSYFPEFPLPLWYVYGGDLLEPFQCKLIEGGVPVDTPCPFGVYTIEEGSIFEAFEVTSVCFTSKWQAVEHPIKWHLQRKDALVDEKDTVSGGFVRLQLSDTPPTGVVVGTSVIYYKPDGGTINGIITLIAVNNLTLNVIESGTILGGFVIFPNLYNNYYIETSILENGTTEIGTLRTIPNSDGSAVVDVHRVLKTKALYDNTYNYTSLTAFDLGISGKYKLKFRACYSFIQEAYGDLTSFAYWSNSAKQIRDLYGSNMAEYVGNLEIPCKFLSVFERPTNFIGYPFSLSFITSGDWARELRRLENGSTRTAIALQSGFVNRLKVSDTATSVSIEYGTMSGSPLAFVKQGDLTETKEIKINQSCLNNAVALSWLNTLGGREHWVFSYNQIYSIDTGVGETFEPYIDDLQNARSNVFDLKRFEQPKITLGASVEIEDIRGLKTILSSICVEINSDGEWFLVRPETGSFKILETKGTTADIEFTIQLPYTNIQSR